MSIGKSSGGHIAISENFGMEKGKGKRVGLTQSWFDVIGI